MIKNLASGSHLTDSDALIVQVKSIIAVQKSRIAASVYLCSLTKN
jgi:hypothetical protein